MQKEQRHPHLNPVYLKWLPSPSLPYARLEGGVVDLTFLPRQPDGFEQRDVYPHYTAEELYRKLQLPVYFTPKEYDWAYAPYMRTKYGANANVLQIHTPDAMPLYFMKKLSER